MQRHSDKPVFVLREVAKGCKVHDIVLVLSKYGYTVKIPGQVQYGTEKAKNKAVAKWELLAKLWFLNNPIDWIIQEPFITWELDEAERARIMSKSPFFRALEKQTQIENLTK
jgi:hypothetical protein